MFSLVTSGWGCGLWQMGQMQTDMGLSHLLSVCLGATSFILNSFYQSQRMSFPLLHNKLAQTLWFKTRQLYYHKILEVRCPTFISLA